MRREFFELYESAKLPVAGEAVLRIKRLYDVQTQTRFLPISERVALRQEYAKPIFDNPGVWLKEQLGKVSSKTPLAKAIKYALARLPKARPISITAFWSPITTRPSARCTQWLLDVRPICSWDQKQATNRPL